MKLHYIFNKSELNILRISRVVSHEAQQVLYSQSIFRCSIPFYATEPSKPPKKDLDQMMKMVINVDLRAICIAYKCSRIVKKDIAAICEAHIGDFTGTEILPDFLLSNSTPITQSLSNHYYATCSRSCLPSTNIGG